MRTDSYGEGGGIKPHAYVHFSKNSQMHDFYSSVFADVPYDLYCPKVFDKVHERTCEECGIYFASKKAKMSHKKIHKPGGIFVPRPLLPQRPETDSEEEEVNSQNCFSDRMPIITDYIKFMASPWEEDPIPI